MSLARGAYSALLILLAPLYLLRLWWRGRREPGYREAIGERFGLYGGEAPTGFVWVHAVSLGETRAASALVEALRSTVPGMRLLLTHGTATGRMAGRDLLHSGDVQCWLPFDTPGATRRFLARFRPAVGVLMETEVWPNLLAAARQAGVPMLLANARLSEKSRAKGARFDALLRPAVESFAAVLAQTEADARRLRASGAREVVVAGNLKFDLTPEPALVERGRAWHDATARAVLLFASSREGEEPALLAAWSRVAAPRPLLVIVPRHPQRFDEVAAMIEAAGFTLRRRSGFVGDPTAADAAADIWLGDSMREMPLYYGLADAALLGGSFAALGGQNLIESLACGCPVVMGPHTFNFAEASQLALEAGAARRVARIDEAVDAALAWLADPAQRRRVAEHGVAFAARHRGAAARMAQRIAAHMVK